MDQIATPFVKLATLGDINSARVCAALLQSAGIEVRLRGEALGPYPVTVGQMAITELWVPQPDFDDAVELMVEAEVDHVLMPEERRGAVADPEALPMRVLAAVILFIVAAMVIRALLRVF